MSKRRTNLEILAERIANRTTELQRTFDKAKANESRLMLERDKVNDQLSQAQSLLNKCRERAAELGLSHIL